MSFLHQNPTNVGTHIPRRMDFACAFSCSSPFVGQPATSNMCSEKKHVSLPLYANSNGYLHQKLVKCRLTFWKDCKIFYNIIEYQNN